MERVPTYLQPRMPFRERLHHFTFAWYTVSMSTSGIALVLALTPHRFTGLDIIGLVIFLTDLVFFTFTTVAITLRFVFHRHTFRKAMTHPMEALFIPTFFLSIAAILSSIDTYGDMFLHGQALAGLHRFTGAAFWAYLAVTFLVSVIQYHLLSTVKEERRLTVNSVTPTWSLPIFPVMLAGTLAALFSKNQPADQALSMLCAGLAAQGLGILVSIFMYSAYLSRLMTFGLPFQRPGMFIAVGPPSFTGAALVAMAADVPRIFEEINPSDIYALAGAGDTATLAAGVRLMALNAAIFLWGLSFWFFACAAAAVLSGMPDRKFHLSWFSFVFPNVGFAILSFRMGAALNSDGVIWLGTITTVLLVVVWLFVGYRCIRAVYKREIVWPGHDEDSL
ncbi:C4-dicarboxylate transporter/malic acid transport protein [Coniochaeta ligniaria NRRL 30616]|uniref:C4-dicarboxylate transporter/malic acid transport protein n=1 Tax=Coniochaeta ligniaria NRRL 30616 TaxID=1408157 RepID=A0A1J7J123_9PEZI|nr:C4-dicarboxylate transporter/malic acid transport protein [Coniochaeta ligniaria NRRL 30616]